MAEVGNWTVEQCSTTGTGDLVLIGSDLGLARFRDSLSAGSVYYSIQDGTNRETGIGTFNGTSTISRGTVTSTLINNVYDDTSPTAITLSGSSIVSCSLNKHAYDDIIADIATNTSDIATNTADVATNTADIATNTSDIADNVTALALKAGLASSNDFTAGNSFSFTTNFSGHHVLIDSANPLLYLNPSVSDGNCSVEIGDGSKTRSGYAYYGAGEYAFLFLNDDTGSRLTTFTIDIDGVTSNGKVNGATVHATNGATGTFTTADGKTITVTDGIITDIT